MAKFEAKNLQEERLGILCYVFEALSQFAEHVIFSALLVIFSAPLEKISCPNEIFSFVL